MGVGKAHEDSLSSAAARLLSPIKASFACVIYRRKTVRQKSCERSLEKILNRLQKALWWIIIIKNEGKGCENAFFTVQMQSLRQTF